MKPVPPTIDGAAVLQIADLATAVSTGRTRHVVDDVDVGDFAALVIACYEGEPGFYLFYCDEDWHPITDTHHETIEEAVEQARFEFDAVEFVGVSG